MDNTARSYQRSREGLTDGSHTIPLRRPITKAGWRRLEEQGLGGLREIEVHEWDRFFVNMIGRFHSDVVDSWRSVLAPNLPYRYEAVAPASVVRLLESTSLPQALEEVEPTLPDAPESESQAEPTQTSEVAVPTRPPKTGSSELRQKPEDVQAVAFEVVVPGEFTLNSEGTAITDGAGIAIPVQRPTRRQWNSYRHLKGLRDLSQKQWPTLIRNLLGKTWDEVKGDLASFATDEGENEQTHQETLTEEEQSQIRQITASARTRAVSSSVVEGVEFHLVQGQGDPKFPEYGVGLYIFIHSLDAERFVNGELSAKEAAKLTIRGRRINHRGDWELRALRAMQAYARGEQPE